MKSNLNYLARQFAISVYYSQALRQSALVTSGNMINGVLMAVAMIFASRILGPTNFGLFSVSIALMLVISKGADFGLNQLLPRLINRWRGEEDKLEQLIGQIIFWKLRLAAATLFVSILSIPLLIKLLSYPHLNLILWAIIGGFFFAIYEYIATILSGFHKFGWTTILSIGQALIKLIGFFGLFLLNSENLSIYSAVYFLAPLIIIMMCLWFLPTKRFFFSKKTANPEVMQVIKPFLLHTGLGALAVTLIGNLDVLMVQSSLSSFDTGVYSGAVKISTFIMFLSAAIGGVLNNRVARYKDKATLQSYLVKSSGIMLIALLGFLLYLPLARLSLVLTIGSEYLSGLSALVILVFNAFLSLALMPYIAFFYAVDYPKYFSISGGLQVLIIFFGNYLFLDQYGIMAAAITKTLATVCFALFTFVHLFYVWKKMK